MARDCHNYPALSIVYDTVVLESEIGDSGDGGSRRRPDAYGIATDGAEDRGGHLRLVGEDLMRTVGLRPAECSCPSCGPSHCWSLAYRADHRGSETGGSGRPKC